MIIRNLASRFYRKVYVLTNIIINRYRKARFYNNLENKYYYLVKKESLVIDSDLRNGINKIGIFRSEKEYLHLNYNDNRLEEKYIRINDEYFKSNLLFKCEDGKMAIKIIIDLEIGFFALLSHCVFASKACFEKGLKPYIFLSSKNLVREGLSKNSLNYYFNLNQFSKKDSQYLYRDCLINGGVRLLTRFDINFFARGNRFREINNEMNSIQEGKLIYEEVFKFKNFINNIINQFYKLNFGSKNLGVHFRGKDKVGTEAPCIEYNEIFKRVSYYLQNGYEKIYVATDEPLFLQKCREIYGDKIIAFRSKITHQTHTEDNSNNFKKNAQAIIDAVLLSKCDALLKTPSFLSAWSVVFNPQIKIETIGKPLKQPWNEKSLRGHGYWPERCLH